MNKDEAKDLVSELLWTYRDLDKQYSGPTWDSYVAAHRKVIAALTATPEPEKPRVKVLTEDEFRSMLINVRREPDYAPSFDKAVASYERLRELAGMAYKSAVSGRIFPKADWQDLVDAIDPEWKA